MFRYVMHIINQHLNANEEAVYNQYMSKTEPTT